MGNDFDQVPHKIRDSLHNLRIASFFVPFLVGIPIFTTCYKRITHLSIHSIVFFNSNPPCYTRMVATKKTKRSNGWGQRPLVLHLGGISQVCCHLRCQSVHFQTSIKSFSRHRQDAGTHPLDFFQRKKNIVQTFLGFPLMDGVAIFRTPPTCSNWIDHDLYQPLGANVGTCC